MQNIAINDDGFAVQENQSGTSLIRGKMLKFADGQFTADKTATIPGDTTLVAVAVITAWVHWVEGRPIEHRITSPGQQHPERDELPDLDENLWPPGLDDQPSDPWKDTRYLHLIDPQSGTDFTFVTDSYGGRRGVGDLKSQIANVRSAHPAAVPVVKLGSTMMKTRFGPKPRPEFLVVGWRGRSEGAAPLLLVEQPQRKSLERRTTPAPEPVPTNDDMDDGIPF
jgi:hypothetical protein